MPSIRTAAFILLAAAMTAAHAGEHVVSQKGKSFSKKAVKVKVGDSVRFVNDDPFSHNVCSLSEAKSFDLGT